MKTYFRLSFFCMLAFLTSTVSCSKKAAGTGAAGMPLVTPPVRTATPEGFRDTSRALDATDFKDRFFSDGPTNMFQILETIDDRITDINSRAASSSAACLAQTPVAYTVTPFGQTVTMYAQCYETLDANDETVDGDPLLVQWGVKDEVTYLYFAIGAQRVAVIATPVAEAAGTYQIQAWIGLGYSNAGCGAGYWDTCSYGVMQLQADSNAGTFEMAIAGIGFGYCGAQIKSDSSNVFATGSTDMGTTCNATDTICVDAADPTNAGTCGAGVTTFDLPSLGRVASAASGHAIAASWGESEYPVTPTITLDGTDSDSLYFGPLVPTTDVGAFE